MADPATHDLIGVADGGMGEQAFCSCGWRTAPKESSWEASTTWHTHMMRSVNADRALL